MDDDDSFFVVTTPDTGSEEGFSFDKGVEPNAVRGLWARCHSHGQTFVLRFQPFFSWFALVDGFGSGTGRTENCGSVASGAPTATPFAPRTHKHADLKWK